MCAYGVVLLSRGGGGGWVPDQVRVIYTKAGGGIGFTSKRGSCSVRVRHWWMLEDLDGGDG